MLVGERLITGALCGRPLGRDALIIFKEENEMQEKHVWKEGAVVTAEDIAASLKPLIDEYFVGECKAAGETLVYTLPDGKKFEISVTEK